MGNRFERGDYSIYRRMHQHRGAGAAEGAVMPPICSSLPGKRRVTLCWSNYDKGVQKIYREDAHLKDDFSRLWWRSPQWRTLYPY
jgi:hypothetical protein